MQIADMDMAQLEARICAAINDYRSVRRIALRIIKQARADCDRNPHSEEAGTVYGRERGAAIKFALAVRARWSGRLGFNSYGLFY